MANIHSYVKVSFLKLLYTPNPFCKFVLGLNQVYIKFINISDNLAIQKPIKIKNTIITYKNNQNIVLDSGYSDNLSRSKSGE